MGHIHVGRRGDPGATAPGLPSHGHGQRGNQCVDSRPARGATNDRTSSGRLRSAHGISRHPMYLGYVLLPLGVAGMLGSVTPFLIVPIFVVLISAVFMQVEERMIEDRFGEARAAYKGSARRWIYIFGKEVSRMPRYDGTGPQGQGPLTGRGEGYCAVRFPETGDGAYGVAGRSARPVRAPLLLRPWRWMWSWFGRGYGRGRSIGRGRGRGRRSGRW